MKARGEGEAEGAERGILCAARAAGGEESKSPEFDVGDGFYLGYYDWPPGSRRRLLLFPVLYCSSTRGFFGILCGIIPSSLTVSSLVVQVELVFFSINS